MDKRKYYRRCQKKYRDNKLDYLIEQQKKVRNESLVALVSILIVVVCFLWNGLNEQVKYGALFAFLLIPVAYTVATALQRLNKEDDSLDLQFTNRVDVLKQYEKDQGK
jgi:di/tricarboxylate transporter